MGMVSFSGPWYLWCDTCLAGPEEVIPMVRRRQQHLSMGDYNQMNSTSTEQTFIVDEQVGVIGGVHLTA